MFYIEKNVNIKSSKEKYPFRQMEIGDSFEFDSDINSKVTSASQQFARNHGYKFSIRKVSEFKHRCWRTK